MSTDRHQAGISSEQPADLSFSRSPPAEAGGQKAPASRNRSANRTRTSILGAAIASLLLVALGCQESHPPVAEPVPARLVPTVRLPSGLELSLEVATTDLERSRGLMFRESLAPDRGMLFVFAVREFRPFWMKNCFFPLDIVWLDEDLTVVSIAENTTPCRKETCPNYEPTGPSLFVLETNAHQAAANGVVPGVKLTFQNLPLDRFPPAARAALEAGDSPAPPPAPTAGEQEKETPTE